MNRAIGIGAFVIFLILAYAGWQQYQAAEQARQMDRLVPPTYVEPTEQDGINTATNPTTAILALDGLGVVKFGDDEAFTVGKLTDLYGKPSKDTGWIDSFSVYGTCPGQKIRVVEWNRLRVFVGDGPYGSKKFFYYQYSDQDAKVKTPDLKTMNGVVLGTTKSDLSAMAGVKIEQTPYDFESFTLATDTYSQLGGSIADGKVSWIFGGSACGE